jgi:hypothetical protein
MFFHNAQKIPAFFSLKPAPSTQHNSSSKKVGDSIRPGIACERCLALRVLFTESLTTI